LKPDFFEPAHAYRSLPGNAGFIIEKKSDRRALALRLGRKIHENAPKHDAPPLGMQAVMGLPRRKGSAMSWRRSSKASSLRSQ
jgi:hypothetical protein